MTKLVSIYYNEFAPYEDLFDEHIHAQSEADIADASAIVVWGGADISPFLYGEGRSSMSGANSSPSLRDAIEWQAMQHAVKHGVPIIGICRGAQMLCALAGGKLFQHVDGHSGNHQVQTYDGHSFTVNSVHHQMMDLTNTEHELIAWCDNRSKTYWSVEPVKAPAVDPEMVWFPTVKGFAVQAHPEWFSRNSEFVRYVKSFIKERMLSHENLNVV